MDLQQEYKISAFSGAELTHGKADEISRLFSENYGRWSDDPPTGVEAGGQIRMSAAKYLDWYSNPKFRFVCCRRGGELVGEAVYLDKETTRGRVAVVLQLVVAEAHRHRGVATEIMRSIWCAADWCLMAVITSNQLTVKAMESATGICGDGERIQECGALLRNEILCDIPFMCEGCELRIGDSMSVVNTRFWTRRGDPSYDAASVAKRYGALPAGWEWFAVVFRDQGCAKERKVPTVEEMDARFPPFVELDDRFSDEAKMLARCASKASRLAVMEAWSKGLSVTVVEDGKVIQIAPDGTKTFVKEVEPI